MAFDRSNLKTNTFQKENLYWRLFTGWFGLFEKGGDFKYLFFHLCMKFGLLISCRVQTLAPVAEGCGISGTLRGEGGGTARVAHNL